MGSLKLVTMKIGIIGSGIVAQVLGKAFISEGNEVMMEAVTQKKKL